MSFSQLDSRKNTLAKILLFVSFFWSCNNWLLSISSIFSPFFFLLRSERMSADSWAGNSQFLLTLKFILDLSQPPDPFNLSFYQAKVIRIFILNLLIIKCFREPLLQILVSLKNYLTVFRVSPNCKCSPRSLSGSIWHQCTHFLDLQEESARQCRNRRRLKMQKRNHHSSVFLQFLFIGHSPNKYSQTSKTVESHRLKKCPNLQSKLGFLKNICLPFVSSLQETDSHEWIDFLGR